jgi:hypothetical protein
MPTPRMTATEKAARGTLQNSRHPQPRSLSDIETAITEANELIESLTSVLKLAQDAISKDGIQCTSSARNSRNETVTTARLNPSVKLLLAVPGQIRLARRELVLLAEERETQRKKEAADSEPNEFAGLD